MARTKTQKPGTKRPAATATLSTKPLSKAAARVPVKRMSANEAVCAVTTPLRWQILGILSEPMTPQQLAQELDVKPAVVLYHLKLLEEAGSVRAQPYGEYKKRFTYARVPFAATVVVDEDGIQADFDLSS